MSMLQLKSLNKYYNHNKENELHVLRDLDLQVEAGEMLAIMGKSGCGKSTLLNILGCVDRFDSGDYILADVVIQDLKDNEVAKLRAKQIAFVLQDFALIERENVFSNVTTPLYFDPTLLLADEPTGSLDSGTSDEVMSLLKDINGLGTTILLVTHDKEIARHCSRGVQMRDGILGEF